MGDKLEVSESNPLFFMIMKVQINKKNTQLSREMIKVCVNIFTI